MAHSNATLSRAIAAPTMGAFLPVHPMGRERVHNRVCPFQAISRTPFGKPSRRTRMGSVTRAG